MYPTPMYPTRLPTRAFGRASRLGAAAISIGLLALAAACKQGDAPPRSGERPQVTFMADDNAVSAPHEVPSGLVDVHIHTTGSNGHHLFFARLNDGVTLADVLADQGEGAADPFFTKMALFGGNGTVAPGTDVSMTLDLKPGQYFALDNPQNEQSPTAPFTVVDKRSTAPEPDSRGVVTMGPGMVIGVPDNFDGRGTWQFVNSDGNDVHEAALVKLAPGATAADVVQWAQSFEGTPPFDGEFGSMGALGPGQHAWMTLDPGAPGDYVLICFIPGRDGKPHVMNGMVRPVTVGR